MKSKEEECRGKVKAEAYAEADSDSDESGQTIVCMGCGSKWRLFHACRAHIIASLEECPLCELEQDQGTRAEKG
jgi:hypothetical protein